MLQESSAYFRGCLSNSFAEALHNEVTLSEIDPSTFALFVDWLVNSASTMSSMTSSECVALWILGDRLLCDGIQTDCFARLQRLHKTDPGTDFGPNFRVPEIAKTELLLLITQGGQTADSSLRDWYMELVAAAMKDPVQRVALMTTKAWASLDSEVVNELLYRLGKHYDEVAKRLESQGNGGHASQTKEPSANNVTYLEQVCQVPRDQAIALLRKNNDNITSAVREWIGTVFLH
jgi:hypothetical protein